MQFVTSSDIRIRDGYQFRIYDAGDTKWQSQYHNGTDFINDFISTVDVNFINASGSYTFDGPIVGKQAASAALNGINLISSGPGIWFFENDQAADEGGYKMWCGSGDFSFYSTNDAGSATVEIMKIIRGTGTAINHMVVGVDIVLTTGYVKPVTKYLNLQTSLAGATGIKVYNSAGTTQGYLYSDGGGTFGLLNSSGGWALKIPNASTNVQVMGDISANNLDIANWDTSYSKYFNGEIRCFDNRPAGAQLPNQLPDKAVEFSFSNIVPSNSTYAGVISVGGWSTTYRKWQLFSNSSTSGQTDDQLYFRSGVNGAWGGTRPVASHRTSGYDNADMHVSTSAPSSPSKGMIWFDIS